MYQVEWVLWLEAGQPKENIPDQIKKSAALSTNILLLCKTMGPE